MNAASTDLDPTDFFDEVETRPVPPLWQSIIKTGRPRQWPKNILVLAAPAAAGRLTEGSVLIDSLVAVVAFVCASIGTYFVNDIADRKADALHPKKRWRPIAAEWIDLRLAWAIGVVFLSVSLVGSALLLNWTFVGLILGYVAITLAYSFRLKQVAVFDLAVVAAGFILRMIAGGVGADVYISEWFLTVGCFSSLFIVSGKRYAEVRSMGEGNTATRKVLAQYNASYLRSIWTMSMTVSIASYFQWMFNREAGEPSQIWYQLTAIPWVLALLRYALRLENGHGGAPEDVLTSDRVLIGLGLAWVLLFAVGTYVV